MQEKKVQNVIGRKIKEVIGIFALKIKLGSSPNALLANVSTVARSAQCSTRDLFSFMNGRLSRPAGHRVGRRPCLK